MVSIGILDFDIYIIYFDSYPYQLRYMHHCHLQRFEPLSLSADADASAVGSAGCRSVRQTNSSDVLKNMTVNILCMTCK